MVSLWQPPPPGPENDVGEALPGHSRPLLRLAKVTQKRGFSRRFSGGFPTVLPVVSRRISGGFPAVRRRFSSGFPASQQQFCQRFSSGSTPVFRQFFRRLDAGFPAVSRQFSSVLPAVFSASSTAVGQRFSSNTPPLDQPRSGSGVPLHLKETVGQFRTHFQAYKPSIAAFSKVCL